MGLFTKPAPLQSSGAVVPSLDSPHPNFSGTRDVGSLVGASNTADQTRSIANAVGKVAGAVQTGLRKRSNAAAPADSPMAPAIPGEIDV